jgi:hypothetical protein
MLRLVDIAVAHATGAINDILRGAWSFLLAHVHGALTAVFNLS